MNFILDTDKTCGLVREESFVDNVCKQSVISNLSLFLSKVAVIPVEEIGPNDSLDTLGVDSAAVISLSAHIEEEFGVITNPDDLVKNATIEQISEVIVRKQKG